ncbi:hypothetical protein HDV63DRAFT_370119 [Trichoderma sp. SZMC 28014]
MKREIMMTPCFALPQSCLLFKVLTYSVADVPYSSTCRKQSCCVASDSRLVFPPLHDMDGSRARVWPVHEMMLHVARFSNRVKK